MGLSVGASAPDGLLGRALVALPNAATYVESAANFANRALFYTSGNQDCTVTLPTPASLSAYSERLIANATAYNLTLTCGGGAQLTLPPLNPDFSIPTAIMGVAESGDMVLASVPQVWATQPAADTALTLRANTHHLYVPVSALSANRTITLPASPFAGQMVEVKDTDGSLASFNIVLAGNGKNIDGSASVTLSAPSWAPKSAIRVVYNGFSWGIV